MAGAWIQMALEQAPNGENGTNAVSSNVFYLRADSIEVNDGFKALEEDEKTQAVMGDGPHLGVESYTPAVEIKGLSVRPADLALVLGHFGGTIVTTPGAASGVTDPDSAIVPVGCTKHVIGWADDTPKTAQIIAKDANGKYWKARGAAANKLAMVFKDGAFTIDVSMDALYGAEIVDPSLTPSFDVATPFRRGDMTLEWLTGSAATKDFDLTLDVGLETSHAWGVVSDYPDLMMFKNDKAGNVRIHGSITKRVMDIDDSAAMRAGTQFAAVVKLTHREDIGATGRTAAAWIEMPGCQHLGETPDAIANVRRRETKFEWAARTDRTTASLATITVVNATAAYETYGA